MNRLKELRKGFQKENLTQEKLGQEIGVTKRTIIAWEKGERDIKSDKAQQLADFFGVSVAYLLGYNQIISDSRSDIEAHAYASILNYISESEVKEFENQFIIANTDSDIFGEAGSGRVSLNNFYSAINNLVPPYKELLIMLALVSKEDRKALYTLISSLLRNKSKKE